MIKLKKVIETCKNVSVQSKYVKINYERLDEIIDKMNTKKIKYWLDSNPFNILELEPRKLINFLLVYHTIGDYCFWGEPKWEIETENGKEDGSFAMMYILLKRVKENKDFKLTYEEFKKMLSGNTEIPLLKNRYDNLCIMNKYLEKNKTDFYDSIKTMTKDEELFNYLINNLSFYKDESLYNNKTVYFYKRAQLLTSDILHVREKMENIKVDYTNLAGCADYKIPQVMHCYGILEFNDELETKVNNKIPIEKDSEMEIEIRANDITVIDYIAKKLNGAATRIDINDYIWLLGQDKTQMTKTYHRTLTDKY